MEVQPLERICKFVAYQSVEEQGCMPKQHPASTAIWRMSESVSKVLLIHDTKMSREFPIAASDAAKGLGSFAVKDLQGPCAQMLQPQDA